MPSRWLLLKQRIKFAVGRIAPFHSDQVLLAMLERLIRQGQVKSFVETGTYLGFSSYYLATRYPYLAVTTIEINPEYYDLSRVGLGRLQNVRQMLGPSEQVLEATPDLFADVGLPLFWLDAHWAEYLPLPQELQLISHRLSQAIIMVDDCAVPHRPDFKYDSYQGRPIDLKLIGAALDRTMSYAVIVPKYDARIAYPKLANPTVTGYTIVLMGLPDLVDPLSSDPFVRQHYRFLDAGVLWD